MNIKEEYNLSLFLLLPLVSIEDKRAEDYLEGYSKALVNAFHYDINKPYLDNHIHIVFDTLLFREREVATIKDKSELEKISSYQLSGIYVKSYALRIAEEYSSSLELILKNKAFNLAPEIKVKILKFWDMPVNSILFDTLYVNPKMDISKEILPEEDYLEDEEEGKQYVTNFSLRSDWD